MLIETFHWKSHWKSHFRAQCERNIIARWALWQKFENRPFIDGLPYKPVHPIVWKIWYLWTKAECLDCWSYFMNKLSKMNHFHQTSDERCPLQPWPLLPFSQKWCNFSLCSPTHRRPPHQPALCACFQRSILITSRWHLNKGQMSFPLQCRMDHRLGELLHLQCFSLESFIMWSFLFFFFPTRGSKSLDEFENEKNCCENYGP